MDALLRGFARSWRYHPAMQSATLTVLVGTFLIIALFFCIQVNFRRILVHWGESVQMIVYLNDEVKPDAVSKIADFLKSENEFETVSLVDKNEAAKRFKAQMGLYSAGFLNDPSFGNPLPASFEVKLKEQFTSPELYDHMVKVSQALTKIGGVDEVTYGQGWIENYSAFIKTCSRASDFLVVILLFGGLFVISNSIRSSIFHRREEIEILELVGATAKSIKAPYLFEGAVMGLLAAAMAQLLCYGLFAWQSHFFGQTLQFWNLSTTLSYLNPLQILGFLVFGAIFGWLGAFICVRSLASGWAASERY